jgi:NAD-dependent dihydropyrimidine dehydrogenase PreA subunit
MPLGYPKTDSGVEMDILRYLYTEEEAEMALDLPLFPLSAQDIAEKTGRDATETADLLKKMIGKGLVYCRKKGEELQYFFLHFFTAIWDLQLNRITPEFNEMMEQYYSSSLGQEVFGSKPPYFKVVLNDKNIPAQLEVLHYEEVSNILKNADRIAVFDCICRLDRRMQGKGCDKPLDVCIGLNLTADTHLAMGPAREITGEEAIQVLDRAEEAGLVHCTTNSISGQGIICNCCGCCCTILRGITQLNLPTAVAKSNFYARSDSDLCTGCGECIERCQVNAVNLEDDAAFIVVEKCIGCGLCVSTCPTEAMAMVRKPENAIEEPPANVRDLLSTIAEEKRKSY